METAARIAATYTGWLALGHHVADAAGARFVRCTDAPLIYDANFVCRVRAQRPEAIDAALAEAERFFGDLAHRKFVTDPTTPPAFTARLALLGYRPEATLQLLLEGELAGPAPEPVEIRAVEDQADWAALRALLRLDHEETARKAGREPYEMEVTEQMAVALRAKAPAVRFWLARAEGRDAAYFSSWPGEGGTGMVEDLFTHPELRGRGLARALIHHAVGDARARGARDVVIGARPGDTPKDAYAAMGFRPACLTWSWLLFP